MDKTMEARKKNELIIQSRGGYQAYIWGGASQPSKRRAGNGVLVIGESENKVKEAGSDNLEEEVIERKVVKKRKAVEKEAIIQAEKLILNILI